MYIGTDILYRLNWYVTIGVVVKYIGTDII